MAYNQQLSVLGQVAPATTGTAGQVLVSAGNSASSYWASAIPVSAYSAQFNGSNYITASSIAFGTSNFTIEWWMRSTESGDKRIMSNAPGAGTWGANKWVMGWGATSAGQVGLGINNSSFNCYTVGASLNNGSWHHVAMVRNGATFTIFVDGVSNITGNISTISLDGGNASPFAIGSGVGSDPKYTGYISNLRVVIGVAVYTGTFTVPTSPIGTAQGSGTNISAVSASQTALLTCNGPGSPDIIDSSASALTITNTSSVTISQYAPFSSFSAIARSATQTQTILTSGSGTYYTPSGVAWLRVRMVGGGGGGVGGSGSSASAGNGTNTTFGTSLLTAGFGYGPVASNLNTPGAGGTASIGAGATGIALNGASGLSGPAVTYSGGGGGGVSPFGGAGSGGPPSTSVVNGLAATPNSGSGGGGGNYGSASTFTAGAGGGAGGYVEAYISSPAASYAYTIGAGGAGGAGIGSAGSGGGGGSGIIIVEENYAVSVVKKSMTQTILTSGSGTYTTPIGVVQLEIRMVGGGGGGGGTGTTSGGTAGTVASAGTNTVFGSSLLTAVAGSGGGNYTPSTIGGYGGAGGTATIGSGATGVAISGGAGGTAGNNNGQFGLGGCMGGSSFFGGGGIPGAAGLGTTAGSASATNSGAGGPGAGSPGGGFQGSGGGAGGFIEAYISSPASSYTYTVGAGGGGGAAGTSGYAGGGGGSGIIIIKEYY